MDVGCESEVAARKIPRVGTNDGRNISPGKKQENEKEDRCMGQELMKIRIKYLLGSGGCTIIQGQHPPSMLTFNECLPMGNAPIARFDRILQQGRSMRAQ